MKILGRTSHRKLLLRGAMAGRLRVFAAAWLLAAGPAGPAGVAGGQAPPEEAEAEPAVARFAAGSVRVGLGGYTRPGAWTPLFVELENPTADDLDLTLSWWLPDAAGDRVQMQRRVAVPADRTTGAWLYGAPGGGPPPAEGWPVVATDAEGEVVAATAALADPARRLAAGEEVILQMSSSDLGLGDYARFATSHADRRLVRGLSLATLPDRVQGFAGVSSIVWAADGGGDPAAAGVPARAIAAWVRRGGHLVVVLPSVGERWTQSPLRPLLPLPEDATLRRTPVGLPVLGVTRLADADAAEAWVLPEGGADTSVLLRATGGEPLIVTGRRGFGAVTLVGIDLASAAYRREALPSGTRRLWSDVFGWSDPALSERREANLRGELAATAPKIKPARELPDVEAGRFLTRSLGLRGSVTLALGVLLLLLVLLPVVAAALWGRARLRKSPGGGDAPAAVLAGPLRWSWPVFAGVCVAGSFLGWGVALAGRPDGPSVRHQSVVDLDPAGGSRRSQSWVSLFVSGFGRADVRVGEEPDGTALLSTAGLPGASGGGGFLDPQVYAMEAADPDAAELPLRSTTRSLRIDRSEQAIPAAAAGVRQVGPAIHRAGTDRLRVELESSLPTDLRDVLIVYCPGEGYAGSQRKPLPPLAWRLDGGTWASGATLSIDGLPERAIPLVEIPPLGEEALGFRGGGWLNTVLDQAGLGAASSPQPGASVDDAVRAWEMLSFFGRLPSPDLAETSPPYGGVLRRSLPELVGVDLSGLTNSARLFVIGHAEGDPLPVPLLVDGSEPPSEGRTVYRVLVDLEEEPRS